MSEQEAKAMVDLFLSRASEARKECSTERDAGRKSYLRGEAAAYEAAAMEMGRPK